MSSPGIGAGALTRSRDDRGQGTIEFVGTVPMMLAVLVILWQCALVGYTFSLAGNAADKGVRAGTVTDWIWVPGGRELACEKAGEEDLPGPWREGADIDCWPDGDLVKATVNLKVPLLFPGGPKMDIRIPGESAAVREN
ncbi:pilus assembly protein [Streptomyces solicathayae]|uniref:Pilus assembly protein n=1 Tax=Streptomyces solicathayae TaxID=3081768 RepID=A0ABZ0LUC7_9ACTN|nr:pilus assembly protein [Streptomyces sp. HUAS YS2]WOX22363.1 pilus assembly protein [Streptomyces sp. HUAS YS2]